MKSTLPNRTLSRLAGTFTLVATCLVSASQDADKAPAAERPAAPQSAVSQADMAKALAQAAAVTPQKVKEFRAALQSVAGGFQTVETGTTPGQATWNVKT